MNPRAADCCVVPIPDASCPAQTLSSLARLSGGLPKHNTSGINGPISQLAFTTELEIEMAGAIPCQPDVSLEVRDLGLGKALPQQALFHRNEGAYLVTRRRHCASPGLELCPSDWEPCLLSCCHLNRFRGLLLQTAYVSVGVPGHAMSKHGLMESIVVRLKRSYPQR